MTRLTAIERELADVTAAARRHPRLRLSGQLEDGDRRAGATVRRPGGRAHRQAPAVGGAPRRRIRRAGEKRSAPAKKAPAAKVPAAAKRSPPPHAARRRVDRTAAVTVEAAPGRRAGIDESPPARPPETSSGPATRRPSTATGRSRRGRTRRRCCSSTRSSTGPTSSTCGPTTASCATCSRRGLRRLPLDWGRPGWEDRGITLDELSASTCRRRRAHRARRRRRRLHALRLLHGRHDGRPSTRRCSPRGLSNLVALTTPIDFSAAGAHRSGPTPATSTPPRSRTRSATCPAS